MGGYNQQDKKKDIFPEFYEKLKDLKISIVPDLERKGIYEKKVQVFNNSVGYASKEEGGNLIVREQWLENPSWTIYLLNEDNKVDISIFNKLKENLLNSKTVFIPYLGKNDHPANIDNVKIVSLDQTKFLYIDSLFMSENISLNQFESKGEYNEYLFKEIVPVGLNKEYNFYEFSEIMFTDYYIENISDFNNVYTDGEMSLFFY